MAEVYRQMAFVGSVLAGFAISFYATMLGASANRRVVGWSAGIALAAAIGMLLVTLGSTFSAAVVASAPPGDPQLAMLPGRHRVSSQLFLGSIVLLLVSFGLSGFARSPRMGWATTGIAGLGLAAVFWVLAPFIS